MATFVFNKLVRDNLEDLYIELNQEARYRQLSKDELVQALKDKLIEEVKEIDLQDQASVAGELADLLQVVEDLAAVYTISSAEIDTIKKEKYKKKGGFSKGLFVETLSLKDDDEWNEYYRKSPDVFKELTD